MTASISKPVILIILDGWGIAPASKGNAVALASTPNMNKLWHIYPHTLLEASGEAVGLPHGETGNSEAGHTNLGAGAIVLQSLPKINFAIADGAFFKKKSLFAASKHVKKNHSSLHLIGLIGSGGVHSNIEHLFALLRWAKEQKIKKLFLHLFTDGRDSPPTSCLKYLKMIDDKLSFYQLGQINTITGRFYAMDRDHRWKRTKIAYEALTEGKGKLTDSFRKTIEASYKNGVTDEFIEPIILKKAVFQNSFINDNDAVIFFNFRIDRPRQLTKAFVIPEFETMRIKKAAFDPYAERYGKRQYQDEEIGAMSTFKRNKILKNLLFITMTEYEPGLPVLSIFSPASVNIPLARVLSSQGLRQLHIAETEKEKHITYYFDGNRQSPFSGEDWVVIPSPKVKTYDLKPEMSAYEITDELIKRIKLTIYDFITVNFANPDMVGHTGVLKAAVKACETADKCMGRIVKVATSLGGTCLITADHGNAEEMIDLKTNGIDTKHSTNPVPFVFVHKNYKERLNLDKGTLTDVAPTVLKILNINQPGEMTGKSLI